MFDWKRWLSFGVLVGSLGCEPYGEEGLFGDASGTLDGTDSGPDAALNADAGQVDSGSNVGVDASTRRDASTPNPGDGGAAADGGALGQCGALKARVRDFQKSHPDFEKFAGSAATLGLLNSTLGSDDKPVFASVGSPAQIASESSFNEWYNDKPGVNQAIEISIPLKQTTPGTFEYDNPAFFPIDGQGFGNEGNDGQGVARNFHFTTEVHTSFTYRGGEVFTFRGDDDLWIFVNGKLALDLGGLHTPVEGTIRFDDQASQLGIVKGETYRMDIFHAERHTSQSNFRISTNIDCFVNVVVI